MKKTEERRRRSSSRQRIDSEFIRKVDDIPVIHNTMEYIQSTYGVMKDVNPLVKNSLERSEDIAFWLRQKTNDVVKATKLEEPLKKLDSAAASSVTQVEKTSNNVGSSEIRLCTQDLCTPSVHHRSLHGAFSLSSQNISWITHEVQMALIH